jgi:hypothetical protein
MGISTVPSFVPVDVATRLTALETANTVQTFMDSSRKSISGGGFLSVDSSFYVKWSQRFIVMGAGRSPTICPNGYFEIFCPTSGTIIGVGGAVNKTATAAGIPLAGWEALYYILPLGSPATSIPANFRVVNYTSDYAVPQEWILLAIRNADGSGTANGTYDEICWCTGDHFTPWYSPALLGGWLHYAVPYGPARFRKYNGCVMGNGLIASGTVSTTTVVFTMPVGFRPGTTEILTAATSPIAGAPYYSEIRVRVDGSVMMQTGTAGYFSFANINYVAEA